MNLRRETERDKKETEKRKNVTVNLDRNRAKKSSKLHSTGEFLSCWKGYHNGWLGKYLEPRFCIYASFNA